MMKLLRRVSVIAPVAGVLALGLALPALADSGVVSTTGAYAAASWDWSGDNKLINVSYSIQDTACDDNPVFAQLLVQTNSGRVGTTKRYNYNGCGNWQGYSGLSFTSNNGPIHGVYVYVCTDGYPHGLGGGDVCAASGYINNPND
ncbi:hypothetical protein NE236_03155 [Actinoallomurus purpureus]|uniref:hypothetical protein n=1 Tax=Actinoallomurus purpureus TaxID=478114 RepID=UPI002092B46D|nr:hypothetical protein [Actinoallomurus purpureus]MCO6003968.1 hypothetical protein [Actinoallomurus purpureus]